MKSDSSKNIRKRNDAAAVQGYWKEAYDAGVNDALERLNQYQSQVIIMVIRESLEIITDLANHYHEQHDVLPKAFYARYRNNEMHVLFVVPDEVFVSDQFLSMRTSGDNFVKSQHSKLPITQMFVPVGTDSELDEPSVFADGYSFKFTPASR